MFVIEPVSDGRLYIEPAIINRLIPTDKQNCCSTWIKGVERPSWPAIMLGSQLAQYHKNVACSLLTCRHLLKKPKT
jgi:hypothetical protein